ncbi:MAG: hypothetical protein ACO29O_04745 [Chitinophagaceae bacterium]
MKQLLYILLLLPISSFSQQSDFKEIMHKEGKFSFISADNLGNIYVLTLDSQLKKFNSKGDSMGVFNDVRRYGLITSINTNNPLRTILYFGNYRTVLILDRFLNVVNSIDLKKSKLFQVEVVCPSYDNNIWVFDEQENKLKKVSEEGKSLAETADLRIALDEAIMPNWITDRNGLVYMYDKSKGLFIFDYYGVLKSKVTLLNWTELQVIDQAVFGRSENKLLKYIPGSLQIQEMILPDQIKKAELLCIQPQGIYVLTESGVTLFSY